MDFMNTALAIAKAGAFDATSDLTVKQAERIARLEAALNLCVDYLEQRSDVVDGDYGQPAPNEEMSLLAEIEEVLGKGGY